MRFVAVRFDASGVNEPIVTSVKSLILTKGACGTVDNQ